MTCQCPPLFYCVTSKATGDACVSGSDYQTLIKRRLAAAAKKAALRALASTTTTESSPETISTEVNTGHMTPIYILILVLLIGMLLLVLIFVGVWYRNNRIAKATPPMVRYDLLD